LCPEKRALNDSNLFFKEKEKEGGEGKSQLGGQWKEKEKHLSTFFHVPPNKFDLNLHFLF
jgi:hypothetical protein